MKRVIFFYVFALVVIGVNSQNNDSLEKELRKAGEEGIPDTDITLKSVECKKKEVLNVIKTIKSVKPRKIIHL